MLAASFSSFDTMNMASSQQQHNNATAQVAEKVMRRIEIAKVLPVDRLQRALN